MCESFKESVGHGNVVKVKSKTFPGGKVPRSPLLHVFQLASATFSEIDPCLAFLQGEEIFPHPNVPWPQRLGRIIQLLRLFECRLVTQQEFGGETSDIFLFSNFLSGFRFRLRLLSHPR